MDLQTLLNDDGLCIAGYLAVIPDFFHGDSVKNKDLSGLAAWLAKHPHEKV